MRRSRAINVSTSSNTSYVTGKRSGMRGHQSQTLKLYSYMAPVAAPTCWGEGLYNLRPKKGPERISWWGSGRTSGGGSGMRRHRSRHLNVDISICSSSSEVPGAGWKNVWNVPTLAPSCDHQFPSRAEYLTQLKGRGTNSSTDVQDEKEREDERQCKNDIMKLNCKKCNRILE